MHGMDLKYHAFFSRRSIRTQASSVLLWRLCFKLTGVLVRDRGCSSHVIRSENPISPDVVPYQPPKSKGSYLTVLSRLNTPTVSLLPSAH